MTTVTDLRTRAADLAGDCAICARTRYVTGLRNRRAAVQVKANDHVEALCGPHTAEVVSILGYFAIAVQKQGVRR